MRQGYKQTELGVIPEDWSIKFLNDFGDVISGGTPSTTVREYWDGGIAWCTPSDITKTQDKYIRTTERTISKNGLKNSAATLLPENSILLCTRATIGELKISAIPMTTNQGFKNLRSNGSANIDFLYYLLQTKKDDMLELSIGSTFLEISKSALCQIPMQTPSISEQERIAEALSDVDSMISLLGKLIAKKKAVKQGAVQELLTGKKRLLGFTEKWKCQSLGQLCYLITKQTGFDYTNEIKPSLVEINADHTIPFIQNKDFNGNMINLKTDYYVPENIALKYPQIILDETCVLISLSGRIGNVGLYEKNNGLAFIGGAVGICRFNDEQLAKWCMLFLQSSSGQRQLFEKQKSGAQHNLTVEDVRKLMIKWPASVEEQTAIISILYDMDNEIEALEQKLAKICQIKQGMMQQLLTGKIRLVTEEKATTAISIAEQTDLPHPRSGHNQQFDDAVMIAAIVNAFYSDKYPLGRKKVQKLLYLLRRKQEADTSAFKKKAAGPYADEVRYKGGEPIAKRQGYIATDEIQEGTVFSKGQAIDIALSYVDKWQMQSDIDWLASTFKYTKTNDLELYATIDMAICDLQHEGIAVSVDSVKELIRSNKAWKAKLEKTYFSDADIVRAISVCKRLYL